MGDKTAPLDAHVALALFDPFGLLRGAILCDAILRALATPDPPRPNPPGTWPAMFQGRPVRSER